MRYECIYCGQGGGSGTGRAPATYNCHGCGRKNCMYPYEPIRQLKEAKQRIAELEEALRYYANVDIYKHGDVPGHIYALDDSGQTAKKTLGAQPQ